MPRACHRSADPTKNVDKKFQTETLPPPAVACRPYGAIQAVVGDLHERRAQCALRSVRGLISLCHTARDAGRRHRRWQHPGAGLSPVMTFREQGDQVDDAPPAASRHFLAAGRCFVHTLPRQGQPYTDCSHEFLNMVSRTKSRRYELYT